MVKLTQISKKTKIISSLTVVVLAIAIGLFLILQPKPHAVTAVELETKLASKQAELDKNYQSVDYSPDDPKVILNPYEISPLTALILFKTNQPESVILTIKGKDNLTTFSHQFPAATEHRLPVYGLYPDTENKIELKLSYQTKELTIKTDALPDNFSKIVSVTSDKANLTNQLYFMTGASEHARTIAFDVNGDVRWYLTKNLAWEIKRSHTSRKLLVSTDRLIMSPYYNTGIYEIDLLGKIYTEYTIPGGYHHDYFERENGNLLIASGGTDQRHTTVEDVVVEIDRQTGNIINTVDFTKIWPMDTGKSIAWTAHDWFHNNSVWLDEKRNELIVSGRHQDAVVILDYKTKQVKYIIGSPEGWSNEMQTKFLKPIGANFEWQWLQHAAKVLPNGDILLFDNGNNKTKDESQQVPPEKSYSRAVIYRLNREHRTIEQIWQYGKERGSDYFSPYISETDYLGQNHYLIHSGGVNSKAGISSNLPAAIAQADKLRSFTTELINNKPVFELVTDQNFYRAEKMPLYYPNEPSLKLTPSKQLGKLNQSYSCSNIPITKAQTTDTEYDAHEIQFKKEEDRLVISGTFDEKSIVKIALTQNGQIKTYDLPVNQAKHQALCIDLSNYKYETSGTNKHIVGYVNSEGLSGTYQIFLQINQRIYDTAKVVQF